MITRVIIAAVLAGLVAGLVMATIQNFRTTPLIIQAETFESAGGGHSHGETTSPAATPQAQEWAPPGGFERMAYSVASTLILAIGLAFLLLGISMLTSLPITPKNGAFWGLVAFTVFTLSPAAGLPPELPAMPAADLTDRQIWWWGTVISGAIGVGLIALRGGLVFTLIAVALFAAPHLIGAPQLTNHETTVPAHLIQEYVANSLFMMAITWIVIGTALGFSMKSQKLIEA